MMTSISTEQVDAEVLPFLEQRNRPDLRGIALEYMLGLTGSDEGKRFISTHTKYLSAIVNLLDDVHPAIQKDALLALVNLTAEATISYRLLTLESHPDFVYVLLKYAIQPNGPHADIVCMVLSNLSRTEKASKKIVDVIVEKSDEVGFDRAITALCTKDYNTKSSLDYMATVLSNLTQIKEARKYVLDKERCVIQRLLPFTEYKQSTVRRGGIVGIIRNCCFEKELHDWLLGDQVDILPKLLLPLAGPEEFDEDDMEKLPEDLQYMQPDKTRETDPDIRRMLVESINQLCASKQCRQYIREKNTYIILRELHKSEDDPAASAAIHNLVSVLIGDEPQQGMDNLKTVEIPDSLEEKLNKQYEEEQKEIADETELKNKQLNNELNS